MKPTATMQMKAADNISSSKPQANFPTNAGAKKAHPAGNETEPSDVFIIGALLFSLLASNQSEIVNEMLQCDG